MDGSELPRPEVRDVVTVDIAEAELSAVRAMLDRLRDEVYTEERAASVAEDHLVVGPLAAPRMAPELEAIQVSRQIVQQMAAARRDEIRTAEEEAFAEAQAQVVEAQRQAQVLATAAHRDASELLRQRLGVDLALDIDPEPAAGLRHWGAPAPAAPAPPTAPAPPSGPPIVAAPPAAVADEASWAHEQFWREEAQATAARTVGVAPVEVLLPTAALLILLLAVLLLIG